MPRTITWLHLSDLHACMPRTGWDAQRVLETLRKDLSFLYNQYQLQPDMIFFTGDIAFGHISDKPGESISDQFREAEDFLVAIRSIYTPAIPRRHVFLVPGNHDVNRSEITDFETEWLAKDHQLDTIERMISSNNRNWRGLMARLEDYERFLETHQYVHLLTKRSHLIYADVVEIAGVRVAIGGFNSAWSSRGAGRSEMGRLWMAGRFQLETILREFEQHDLRIALVHHPGNWLVPEENPTFMRMIERDFHFVLHGHEHQDFIRSEASNGHTVISSGACHEWSQGKNNGYSVVQIDVDEGVGTAWLRKYDSAGGGWVPRVVHQKTDNNGRWRLNHLKPWTPTVLGIGSKSRHNDPSSTNDNSRKSPKLNYEERYRRAIVARLDYMNLFGIDASREATEYSLSVAYVSLNLADENIDPNDEEPKGDVRSTSSTSISAEAFFDKLNDSNRKLLIRGPAGCGKTTLLRWAAVEAGRSIRNNEKGSKREETTIGLCSSQRELTELDWRTRVPFLIRLRDYSDGELPRPSDYPRINARQLPDPPAGWIDEVLTNGRALLMFDGVDEVPSTRREDVLREIRELMRLYANNAFVITTRPEAVERESFRELGYLSARVENLSRTERNTLVDRWHDAMQERLRRRRAPEDLKPIARELKERLEKNPSIARLTVNPLLCAATCALHYTRRGNLPVTSVGLCEKLCEMLLDRRDRERRGMPGEIIDGTGVLDYERRKGLLARLGYHMVRMGLSSEYESAVDKLLSEGLRSYGLEHLNAQAVRRELVERSGMLQESSEQKIEFIHNTLKEFLAAWRFVNRDEVDIMAENCHEESWQPVILFALALPREGSNFATRLVRAILSRTPMGTPPSGRSKKDRAAAAEHTARQFFFFRCHVTAYQLDDNACDSAFSKLKDRLLPPKKIGEAEALATCGEPIVQYLSWNKHLRAKSAAASVRALSLIGGPHAMRLLGAYCNDERSVVRDEVVQHLLTSPGTLTIRGTAISERTHLNLGLRPITDLSGLSEMTKLISLSFYPSRGQASGVEKVTGLKRLTTISMSSLPGFSRLPNLISLRLNSEHGFNRKHAEWANLSNLRSLDLSRSSICDISMLRELGKLEQLQLSNTAVEEIVSLGDLSELKSLDLSHTRVSDLSPLRRLHKLVRLEISNTDVSDLSPVRGATNLRFLDVTGTSVKDISPLAHIANIQELRLTGTLVNDLSALERANSLRTLHIANAYIEDVSPISRLPNIRVLILNRHKIRNLSVLTGLAHVQLRVFHMEANKLSLIPFA